MAQIITADLRRNLDDATYFLLDRKLCQLSLVTQCVVTAAMFGVLEQRNCRSKIIDKVFLQI